jgi:two-component system sensor histidine kinase KdpD
MPASIKPTPEQLLSQLQEEEEYACRGRLKVFLGYASGVGKSFRMLDEGRRRRERGEDVVVGATQPETSPELQKLLIQLETVPLGESQGIAFMDLPRIVRRHPQVCLVDGLAYDNPPDSRNPHRWQDVEELLDSGISVLGTINLQFVAERQCQVERIRGKSVSVSVPEAFLRKAYEIVVVDAPAEFCTWREDKTASAAPPIAEQQKLSQLREIALLLAADVVDEQLEAYLKRQGVAQSWGTQERLLVCLTANTNASRMLERARLTRERFHGELFAAYVGESNLTGEQQQALQRNLEIAQRAGADVRLLEGEDEVKTIIDFAHKEGITQIFIGHSLTGDWRARFTRTTADRLIRAAEGIDVKLFPH